jgi:prepilin-type N-terminal cleavage/methylation domain-containing protein
MTSTRRSPREAGFSLLEMLIAFAIMATAATSLFLLGATTAVGNTRSKEHAAASALAVDKIEELRNTPFDDIVPNSDAPVSGSTFARTWTVSSTTVSGVPAKDITVTVTGEPDITVALTTTFVDPPVITTDYFEGFPTAMVRSWSQR